jgi:hypothetical protein
MLVDSGVDNWLVGPHNSRIEDTLQLLANLLPGSQNTAFCQKKRIKSKKTHNRF